jgi:hypothetical protein
MNSKFKYACQIILDQKGIYIDFIPFGYGANEADLISNTVKLTWSYYSLKSGEEAFKLIAKQNLENATLH